MTHDPEQIAPRPGVPSGFRPWMAAAPLALIAVGGLAFVLISGGGDRFGPVGSGRMQVEVVAPVEPVVEPGGTMEVGDLVDGYAHTPIQPVADVDAYDADYQTAWVEPLPPLREPSPTVWRSDSAEPPVRPQGDVIRSDGGRFGFDAPGPDYAAERRARQERLDRIQADQAMNGRPGTPAVEPGLDRESAFY